MSSLISIIIPCFNSGEYLPDALSSVESYRGTNNYEIIIVNDGSTDLQTIKLLEQLKKDKLKIIEQENKGPAAARNTGVKASTGEYILFLDSDNKIRGSYIDIGIELMNNNQDIGVVYGKPFFFGDTNVARFNSRDFCMSTLLLCNYIDMCSVVRKSMLIKLGGLDESQALIGHEDWELWIRAGAAGWKFRYVDKVLYEYRVRENSLVKQSLREDEHAKMLEYLYIKHLKIFLKNYKDLYNKTVELSVSQNNQINLIKALTESSSYKLGNLLIRPLSRIKDYLYKFNRV
jgi:glycosyltransferase involved in cell wall biosynthesis